MSVYDSFFSSPCEYIQLNFSTWLTLNGTHNWRSKCNKHILNGEELVSNMLYFVYSFFKNTKSCEYHTIIRTVKRLLADVCDSGLLRVIYCRLYHNLSDCRGNLRLLAKGQGQKAGACVCVYMFTNVLRVELLTVEVQLIAWHTVG